MYKSPCVSIVRTEGTDCIEIETEGTDCIEIRDHIFRYQGIEDVDLTDIPGNEKLLKVIDICAVFSYVFLFVQKENEDNEIKFYIQKYVINTGEIDSIAEEYEFETDEFEDNEVDIDFRFSLYSNEVMPKYFVLYKEYLNTSYCFTTELGLLWKGADIDGLDDEVPVRWYDSDTLMAGEWSEATDTTNMTELQCDAGRPSCPECPDFVKYVETFSDTNIAVVFIRRNLPSFADYFLKTVSVFSFNPEVKRSEHLSRSGYQSGSSINNMNLIGTLPNGQYLWSTDNSAYLSIPEPNTNYCEGVNTYGSWAGQGRFIVRQGGRHLNFKSCLNLGDTSGFKHGFDFLVNTKNGQLLYYKLDALNPPSNYHMYRYNNAYNHEYLNGSFVASYTPIVVLEDVKDIWCLFEESILEILEDEEEGAIILKQRSFLF